MGVNVIKETNKEFEVDGIVYETLPEVVNEALAYLMLSWERAGRPKSVFSEGGEKLMETIISSWQDLFPQESREWIAMREEYKKEEKDLRQIVREESGRSIASVPLYVHKLMDVFFKDDLPHSNDFYKKLVKKYPIFRLSKYS